MRSLDRDPMATCRPARSCAGVFSRGTCSTWRGDYDQDGSVERMRVWWQDTRFIAGLYGSDLLKQIIWQAEGWL